MDTKAMDCFTVGIEVFPIHITPPPVQKILPDKLLAILRKYKFNWRINQLSKPMRIIPKYVSIEEGRLPRFQKIKPVKLDECTKFYADQLAAPALKNITDNRRIYGKINKKLTRKLNKNLKKAWASIYNFYKKREREKVLRQRRREAEQSKEKEKKKSFERTATLAIPKQVYKPPPPSEPKKIFENFDHLDVLAAPKVYIIQPAKKEGVNPLALTYEPTEVVFKLAKLPERFKNIPKMLVPGVVRRAALRYKITPRVEALCVPKTTREKAQEDDGFDPWAISKNALKYKATPRMLELAKPLRE